MNNNNKESYQPFHYTQEGEKFFGKIIEKYGLKENIEYLIIPLINGEGEEKEEFIPKTKKMNFEDGKTLDIEEHIKQVLDEADKDGFNINVDEAQAVEAA